MSYDRRIGITHLFLFTYPFLSVSIGEVVQYLSVDAWKNFLRRKRRSPREEGIRNSSRDFRLLSR